MMMLAPKDSVSRKSGIVRRNGLDTHVSDAEPSAGDTQKAPLSFPRLVVLGKNLGEAHMPENFCVMGASVRYMPATSAASPKSHAIKRLNDGPPLEGSRSRRRICGIALQMEHPTKSTHVAGGLMSVVGVVTSLFALPLTREPACETGSEIQCGQTHRASTRSSRGVNVDNVD
jgi:hypothetical protein